MKTLAVGVSLLSAMFVIGLVSPSLADCGSCGKDGKAAAGEGKKVPDLSTDDLKKAIEAGAVVYDVRGDEAYKAGHIPGAKSLPLDQVSDKTLGDKKDVKVVFYCGSTQCPLSAKAAAKAVELGYTAVHTYEKGIKGWQEDGGKVETQS